jgi:hypothetical protein
MGANKSKSVTFSAPSTRQARPKLTGFPGQPAISLVLAEQAKKHPVSNSFNGLVMPNQHQAVKEIFFYNFVLIKNSQQRLWLK